MSQSVAFKSTRRSGGAVSMPSNAGFSSGRARRGQRKRTNHWRLCSAGANRCVLNGPPRSKLPVRTCSGLRNRRLRQPQRRANNRAAPRRVQQRPRKSQNQPGSTRPPAACWKPNDARKSERTGNHKHLKICRTTPTQRPGGRNSCRQDGMKRVWNPTRCCPPGRCK